jgi:methionyl-tRNA synthetase
MKKPFFVTTPIYYSNGIPHIGHSYSSLIADVLARHRRMTGFDVKFSTGVDENSQKVVEKAAEAGKPIMQYADEMAAAHKAVWDGLGISYTDFIRTTEKRHHDLVREVLQKTYDAGDIYEGVYEGLYCVGCEAFKKKSDLTEDGLCPDHLKKPEVIKEKNWFFRLSKYRERLLALYEDRPDFVQPRHRFNEVIEFLKQEELEDLSISRETNTFGIPLPFDASQVTYVWYDALFNYVTVCQGGDERFWPADLHVVGKEIIRFHAVYWPAMLMAVGLEIPKKLLVTGFLTNEGQKISKSLGNVIDPVEFAGRYSRDMLVLYLLTAFPIGGDGDFSEKEAVLAFNAKLANNVGNLLNRFLVLTLKLGGTLPTVAEPQVVEARNVFTMKYQTYMGEYDPREALLSTFEFGDFLNKYVDTAKPWEKDISTPDGRQTVEATLSSLGEGLRTIGIALYPFFEEKMSELLTRIGASDTLEMLKQGRGEAAFSEHSPLSVKEKGDPLYARIQL